MKYKMYEKEREYKDNFLKMEMEKMELECFVREN